MPFKRCDVTNLQKPLPWVVWVITLEHEMNYINAMACMPHSRIHFCSSMISELSAIEELKRTVPQTRHVISLAMTSTAEYMAAVM